MSSGRWGGLQVRITQPELTAVLETVSSAVEYSNTALDIGLSILQVVRTFVPGNLNLIRALVTELIALVRNLSADLRQIGLYAHTGDLELLRSRATLAQLKGGYAAYERRMLTRLRDRRDLRRPDFSPSTTVVALFIYTGADVGFVGGVVDPQTLQPLRQFAGAFARLLGLPAAAGRNASLPVASNVAVSYPFSPERGGGEDSPAALAVQLAAMAGRNTAIVSWGVAPAPGSSDAEPAPPIPPGGWLVEVSCYPSGFYVGYLCPTPSSTGNDTGEPSGSSQYTTGVYYETDTGQPLRLYGGVDSLSVPEELGWAGAFDGDRLREGAAPVFYFRDLSSPEVIRTPFALRGGRYYNQRTFFVPRESIASQALHGGVYHLELRRDQLPLVAPFTEGELDYDRAVPAQQVYVRVTAVSSAVTAENITQFMWDLKAHRTADDTRVHVRFPFGDEDRGVPSEIVEVSLPDPEGDQYGIALQVSLALMVLVRADLQPPDPVTSGHRVDADSSYVPTSLESIAAEAIPEVLPNPTGYFARRGVEPDVFVRDLYDKVVSLADRYIRIRGEIPPAAVAALRPQMERLLAWKWSDGLPAGSARVPALEQTVLSSLTRPRTDPGTTALARNPYSLADSWQQDGTRTSAELLSTAQSDFDRAGYGIGAFYEGVPVVYSSTTRRVYYPRALVTPELYAAARAVLALTAEAAPQRGGWVVWRPFAGAAPMGTSNRILAQVEGFLRSVLAGVSAVADALKSIIDFLEQRIRELQELLLRIKGFLEIPFQISIPDVVALPLVVNGTEGVIAGLQAAENKPTDGPGAYSGGIVIMGGGLPSILTDLLLFFLGQT